MSFISPTIALKVPDHLANVIAESYLASNPDVTVDDINSSVISDYDRKSGIRTVRAPVAHFIEEDVSVTDFEGTVSQMFTQAGDRYMMLTSGDIVNYSLDVRNAAIVIHEKINAS